MFSESARDDNGRSFLCIVLPFFNLSILYSRPGLSSNMNGNTVFLSAVFPLLLRIGDSCLGPGGILESDEFICQPGDGLL